MLPLTLGCSSSSNGGSPNQSDAATDTGSPTENDATAGDSSQPQNDSGNPGADSGQGPVDSGTNSDAAPVSFSTDVYANIISAKCLFCHGPTADGGPGIGIAFGHLDMSTETLAYANLLGDGGGAPAGGVACGTTGLLRVVPGNPTQSLLYNKLASNDGDGGSLLLPDGGPMVFCGHPMPENHPAIGATDLAAVQTWIAQGGSP
jgi:hypothetical protein